MASNEPKQGKTTSRDKRLKFVELANKRVTKALKDLELIANLANRRNYEYDDEQAKKIVKALQSELEMVKQSFLSEGTNRSSGFKL
jgi:hypothetical protein